MTGFRWERDKQGDALYLGDEFLNYWRWDDQVRDR